MKKIIASFVMASALSFNAFAYSNTEDTVKNVTTNVISQIKQNKSNVNNIIINEIIPHVDMEKMTAMAVGKDWKKATSEQKLQLVDEFKTLLIRTYSNALKSYSNEKIEVGKINYPTPDEANAKILVFQDGKPQPVIIELELIKKTTDWKTTDIKIAGVSLVSNYRSSFAQEVQNNGIDGLIQLLKDKNSKNEQSQMKK